MVRLKLRDLRLLVRTLGFLALAAALFFFLIARLIYGNGESRFRIVRWLFLTFNNDLKDRQPHGCAHFFSPLQKKVFEAVFSASKGNPDGSFQFDFLKVYKLLWPADEVPTEIRRGQLTQAFTELCEDYFYFPMPFGKSFVLLYMLFLLQLLAFRSKIRWKEATPEICAAPKPKCSSAENSNFPRPCTRNI